MDFLIAHQWIDVTIDTQTVLAVTGLVDVVVVGEVKGETEEVVETGGLEMVAVQKVRELILKGYFFLSFSRMSVFYTGKFARFSLVNNHNGRYVQ